MWKDILKAPVYVGEEYPDEDKKFRYGFEWLVKFAENNFNIKFISKDKKVRATVFLDYNKETDKLFWLLDTFATREDVRGQGLGEIAVQELIDELKEKGDELIKQIYKNILTIETPFKQALAAGEHSLKLITRKIEERQENPYELDLVLGSIEYDAMRFWQKMVNRYDIKKAELRTTQTGSSKVRSNPLPEKEKEIEPKKDEPPPRCIQVYREIVNEIETQIEYLVDVGKAYGFVDYADNQITSQTLSYNFTGSSHMHRNYDKSFLCPYIKLPENEKQVIMVDYTYAAPDNISEKDACVLLAILSKTEWEKDVEFNMDYYRFSTFDTLGDIGVDLYNSDNYPTISNIQLSTHVAKDFKMVIDKEKAIEDLEEGFKPEKYESDLKEMITIYNRITTSLYDEIVRLAKAWADSQDDLDSYLKKSVNPLGEITEYHGTLDIEGILREGITGGYTRGRSNKHIPKELRNVERITYTTESKEEALEFAKRRAKELGIPESNVGVVGVRTKNLKEPVLHKDIRINAITFVREGGIPAENLERVE